MISQGIDEPEIVGTYSLIKKMDFYKYQRKSISITENVNLVG